MNKIAIFGGSFDPIHKGHITIIKTALTQLNIDKIIVIPTYLNPFKRKSYFSPKKRLEIVEKRLKNIPNLIIERYEIDNQSSYTIDTIKYIKEQYKSDKIYLIIGADNLKKLHKWHKIEEIKELAEFVIATRNSIKIPNGFKILKIDINISSTEIRNRLIK